MKKNLLSSLSIPVNDFLLVEVIINLYVLL